MGVGNALLATAGTGDDLLVGYCWLDSGEVHLQHRPTRGEQSEDDIRRAFCTRIPATAWGQVCGAIGNLDYWTDPQLPRASNITAGYGHWTFKRKIVRYHGAVLDQVWIRTAPLGAEVRGHLVVLAYADWDGLVGRLAGWPGPSLLTDLDKIMTAVMLRRRGFIDLRGQS